MRCNCTEFAAKLLEEGIYVIGFYPVVAKGKARIRVQLRPRMNNITWIKLLPRLTNKELGVLR